MGDTKLTKLTPSSRAIDYSPVRRYSSRQTTRMFKFPILKRNSVDGAHALQFLRFHLLAIGALLPG